MPELTEHDLHSLFRGAGRPALKQDLTDRIMAQVAVTPIARPVVVKPVIGKWGWVGIAASAGVLIVLTVSSNDATGTSASWLTSAIDRLSQLRLPEGSWPVWAAIASAGALAITALDLLLRKRVRALLR